MKTLICFLLLLTIALVSVTSVRAQQPDTPNRMDVVYDAISDATGLTREQIIRMERQDGLSLAEIISENGGDVDEVQAQIVAAFTEELNAQIDGLDERVGNLLNSPPSQPNNDRDQALTSLLGIIIERSDLDRSTIRQQLAAGITVADIARAAGLDPDEVAASAIEQYQERLDGAVENGRIDEADAAARAEAFGAQIDLYMNTPVEDVQRMQATARRVVLRAAADSLNVRPRDIWAGIDADQSLADYIAANGSDPGVVMDFARERLVNQIEQAVENERISREDADMLLESLDATLDDIMTTAGVYGSRGD